jgi:ribonuclease P protein component
VRFAVLVGKKLGLAVVRNRYKRWAREAFRQNRDQITEPGDIIVRVNREIESYSTFERLYIQALPLAIADCRRLH